MNIHPSNTPVNLGATSLSDQQHAVDSTILKTAAEFFKAGLAIPTVPSGSSTSGALIQQFQQLSTQTSEQLALYLPKPAHSRLDQGYPHTRIRTQHGRYYELLNTLNQQDTALIEQQFGMPFENKVVLGTGGSSKIRFAKNTENQHVVVVKKIPSRIEANGTPESSLERATHETNIMGVIAQGCSVLKQQPEFQDIETSFALCLDHQHITKPNQPTGMENKSYVFYEFANEGDGIDHIQTMSRLKHEGQHDQAKHMFKHVVLSFAKTVMHLHALGIHHRDIKPDNFLFFSQPNSQALPNIRLGDFGFAHAADYAQEWAGDTPVYTPPEAAPAYRQTHYHAEKHDCFSLGMSLLTARLGEYAYESNATHHLTLKTKQGETHQVRLRFNSSVSDRVREKQRCQGVVHELLTNLDMSHFDCIVAKLIAKNPADRISSKEAFDLLSKIL